MSEIASGVLQQQLDLIATRTGENKWLTREQTSGVQQQNPPGFVGVAVAG
ncbi:DNA helicase IV [Escherichia coli]|nr:DNA helicase IV [Escherichia coli]